METNNPSNLKQLLSSSLIDEILSKVLENYSNLHALEPQQQTTESKKEHSPMLLSDFVQHNNLEVIHSMEVKQNSTQNTHHLKQLRVNQQHVFNLCGYHTYYNMQTVVNLLKSQDLKIPHQLFNQARFWEFHFKTTTYLDKYAEKNKPARDKYPWNYRHIRWGELERAYLKILTEEDPEFGKLVSGNEKFKIGWHSFQFQFGRLIYGMDWLNNFKISISEFVEHKEQDVHMLKLIMMGVTNHWYLFVAHKYNDRIEFWILDSNNIDYHSWTSEQIIEYVQSKNEERKKNGQPVKNNFQIWVAENGFKDAQIANKVLVNCFLGNITLEHFIADCDAEVLTNSFLDSFSCEISPNDENLIEKIKDRFKHLISGESQELDPKDRKENWEKVQNFVLAYKHHVTKFINLDKLKLISKKLIHQVVLIMKLLNLMIHKYGSEAPNQKRYSEIFEQTIHMIDEVLVH